MAEKIKGVEITFQWREDWNIIWLTLISERFVKVHVFKHCHVVSPPDYVIALKSYAFMLGCTEKHSRFNFNVPHSFFAQFKEKP